MSKLTRGKKCWILLLVIILILRLVYLFLGDGLEKEYYTSSDSALNPEAKAACREIEIAFQSDNKRLQSIELGFTDIPLESESYFVLQINKDAQNIYETKLLFKDMVENEWMRIFVNAELDPTKIYTLTLTAQDTSPVPNILLSDADSTAPEILSSSISGSDSPQQFAIRFGYLRPYSLWKALQQAVISIAVCLLCVFPVLRIDGILQWIRKALLFLEAKLGKPLSYFALHALASFVVLEYGALSLDHFTKLLLLTACFFSMLCFEKSKDYVACLFPSAKNRFLLYFTYVYAAFSLFGQRLLLYPLNSNVSINSLLCFMVSILWFVPLINALFYCLGKSLLLFSAKQQKLKTGTFVAICLSVLILPLLINLIAYNPGISTVDSHTTMIVNAKNPYGMVDWHPAIYSLMLYGIQMIWDSTYAVILLHILLWCCVVLEMLLFLRQKGLKDSILLGLVFFLGWNPANYLHILTLWKDIPYTLFLLWLSVLLSKLTFNTENKKLSRWFYLKLIIALLGVYFFRKNGIVPAALCSVTILLIYYKNKAMLLSFIAIISVILLIQGPLYTHYQVQDPRKMEKYKGGVYIGLGQDILGTYYAGGEVSEDTLKMIDIMTNKAIHTHEFNLTYAQQSYDLDVSTIDFIKNYLDTFLKNPILMTKAIIGRQDAAWNILPGYETQLVLTGYSGTAEWYADWKSYYPIRINNIITSLMDDIHNRISPSKELLNIFIWRSGLFSLLGLIASVFILSKKGIHKKTVLLFTPAFGQFLSLVLSTGWADFRYYWPLNLLNLYLIFQAFLCAKDAYCKQTNETIHI